MARAVIDVSGGKLVLRVGDEEVTFLIAQSLRHSAEQDDKFYFLDVVDVAISECV